MSPDILIFVLASTMLVGSFIAGLLPALIKASNRVMNLISILGAGLLVGVALIVIIPEGMLTLNKALEPKYHRVDSQTTQNILKESGFSQEEITRFHMPQEGGKETHVATYLGGSLIFGFLVMLLIDQIFLILKERLAHEEEEEDEGDNDYYMELDESPDKKIQLAKRASWKFIQNSIHSKKKGCHRVVRCASYQDHAPRMLSDDFTDQKLVDAMGNVYMRHDPAMIPEEHWTDQSHEHAHEHFHGDTSTIIISTLGLVVHSVADGIALGSTCYASQDSDTSLPLVIFFALLLHKCPAAIGLTTFLRHEMLTLSHIVCHLAAFTVTSPVFAVLSYFIFKVFAVSHEEDSNTFKAVGILLLISAGSFMYVAMIHILPEVYCNTESHRPHTHKHTPEDHIHDENHFSKEVELGAMVTGLLAPLLLNCL